MLPDIRAVIAVVAAAVGLLMMSFALVATFRVAQDSRAGSLQADLAQRGRAPLIASAAPRAVVIVDTPAPAETEFVPAAVRLEALEIESPVAPAPLTPLPAVMAGPPAAEPPMGGPLPERIAAVHADPPRDAAAEVGAKNEKKAAAKKARAARIARQRKAAARRAAQAQRAQEDSAAAFGNIFRQ